MRIGNYEIKGVAVAPMAGITDRSFRRILKELGTGLLVTEMVSAKAITMGSKKTRELMQFGEDERPLGIQIFGSEPEVMAEAARQIAEEFGPDFLDINMGCPVPKIVNNNEGSALLLQPELAAEIVFQVRKHSNLPVSVKLRKGFALHDESALVVAPLLEEAGAAFLTIHGRTREEYYSGKADWEIIRRVKEKVQIPVIGNGDVKSVEDYIKMLEVTDCDAVMVGRGLAANPFLAREIKYYLETGNFLPKATEQELWELAQKHLDLIVQDKGERIGVREMRGHLGRYTRGLKNSAALRREIFQAETKDEMRKMLFSFFADREADGEEWLQDEAFSV